MRVDRGGKGGDVGCEYLATIDAVYSFELYPSAVADVCTGLSIQKKKSAFWAGRVFVSRDSRIKTAIICHK